MQLLESIRINAATTAIRCHDGANEFESHLMQFDVLYIDRVEY